VRAFYVKATAAIRTVDTNHIIFACGTSWCGSPEGVTAILPPWDKNMVLVFHKYWDKNDKASISGYESLRTQYNIPLWNGETGENSASWGSGMAKLLADANIGWSWWTFKKVNSDTQPCSIPEPQNYKKILDYVSGSGSKPSMEQAQEIFLSLATSCATSKCEWHNDILIALGLKP